MDKNKEFWEDLKMNKNPELLELKKLWSNKAQGRLGVQMDGYNCISYALQFADEMYGATNNEIKKNKKGIDTDMVKDTKKSYSEESILSETDVLSVFDKVFANSETETRIENGKEVNFFMLLDCCLRYAQSIGTLRAAGADTTELELYKEEREKMAEKEITEELKSDIEKLNKKLDDVKTLQDQNEIGRKEKSIHEDIEKIMEKTKEKQFYTGWRML
ncbi:hypothetical protein FACS1894152_1530 [Bacilli bacterium]|nr:hypothetical protein FACS1894152_1530 [Bacilli bacterium]